MKRILSFAIVCMMLMTSVSAMAADPAALSLGSTIEVADVTKVIRVPVDVVSYGYDAEAPRYEYDEEADENVLANNPMGLASFQFEIEYDSAVLTFNGSLQKGTIVMPTYAKADDPAAETKANYGVTEEVVAGTTKKIKVMLQPQTNIKNMLYDKGTLFKVPFKMVVGNTQASTTVKLTSSKWYSNQSNLIEYNSAASEVEIKFPVQETTKYAVSASANNADYGTVALDANEVEEGGKVTVTATPAEGYEVESYTVNGGEAIAANSNTFEVADIKEATTIVVNFKKVVRVTAVKTFDNRLYEENTLYTGVIISEGDDYAAATTIKAGINIAKGEDRRVNYWLTEGKAPISIGNNTSVYVIGLNNVTDTTDITKASASKGVVVVGNNTYYGEDVTAIYGE